MSATDGPRVVQAERILVGHCPNPECGPWGGWPIAVLNDREVWPLAHCGRCGWIGTTTELVNRYRLDAGWRVSDGDGPERELRPAGKQPDDMPWTDAEGPNR